MRKVRIISLLLTLCFLAVDVFAALILYKSYKDKKRAKAATPEQASAAVVRASNDENSEEVPSVDTGGIQFNVGNVTGYFLELKLKGGWRMVDKQTDSYGFPLAKTWKDRTADVTLVLTFTDIKYKEQPVFVSVFSPIKVQKTFGHLHKHVKFTQDFTEENGKALRIPETYYAYLKAEHDKGASLQKFNIMFMWDSGKKAAGLNSAYECSVARLYTKEIPAGSNDPESPFFKLDNWSGIMSAFAKETGCGSGCTDDIWGTLKPVLIVIAVAFGVAIVVWLLRTFIGLLRGK